MKREMTPPRKDRQARLGALPPRYSFVLNPHTDVRFTKCPRCEAPTRVRKLALVVHVEHSDGPRLAILGKTCRLCVVCETLVVQEADVERLVAASGLGAKGLKPVYLVLGTVAPQMYRRGLAGGVSLPDIREHMADFKAYLNVDVTPRGRYPKSETLANVLQPTSGKQRRNK
jgi:hypothetical protein